MALKCRGGDSPLNFAMAEYAELLPMLAKLSKVRLVPDHNRINPTLTESAELLSMLAKLSEARACACHSAPQPPLRDWLGQLALYLVSAKE